MLDRRGEPLNATFTNGWNLHDAVPLHEIPPFLRAAFVTAEDKRFFEHAGPDWRARLSAAWTNVKSGRAVRGASTISEQVVRMLHPRPRTVWSRWLEGWEASELERRFTKSEILELYLNQVPYASNRRGVRQAARYYFARDLATLSKKEMLALAVLVRAQRASILNAMRPRARAPSSGWRTRSCSAAICLSPSARPRSRSRWSSTSRTWPWPHRISSSTRAPCRARDSRSS